MSFILWHDGKEHGPYDLASIEESVANGDLQPSTLARRGDSEDWKPLETLLPRKAGTKSAPKPDVSNGAPSPIELAKGKTIKNVGARRLSYILIVFGVILLGKWAVGKLDSRSFDQVLFENATEAQQRISSDRLISDAFRLLEMSRINNEVSAAMYRRAERVTESLVVLSCGVLFLLTGTVIRVYS